MQINSDNNLISKLAAQQNAVPQGGKQQPKSDNNVSAALDSSFGAILSKALTPPDDTQLIEQVRQELREGRLESDRAFEQAAENLLKFGL